MALEDILHPLLGSYIASPQWVKSSVGRLYSWVPLSMRRGRNYGRFWHEAQLRDPHQLEQLARHKLATTLRWALETVPAYHEYRYLLKQFDDPLALLRSLPTLGKHDLVHRLPLFLSRDMAARSALKKMSSKNQVGGITSSSRDDSTLPVFLAAVDGLERREQPLRRRAVHQERLERVADTRALHLGVAHDVHRPLLVG